MIENFEMNFTDLIGILGALTILFGFVMDQSGKWKNTERRYDALNFLGAVLLSFYAFEIGSIPFIIINTVWALVSLKDLLKKK